MLSQVCSEDYLLVLPDLISYSFHFIIYRKSTSDNNNNNNNKYHNSSAYDTFCHLSTIAKDSVIIYFILNVLLLSK